MLKVRVRVEKHITLYDIDPVIGHDRRPPLVLSSERAQWVLNAMSAFMEVQMYLKEMLKEQNLVDIHHRERSS